MNSIWRRGTQPAKFRTAWRGYDRTEVDEFLRRMDADRQRLQEEVSQLSALMSHSGTDRRELERLAAVRREVASCLETSIGALRTATGLLGGNGHAIADGRTDHAGRQDTAADPRGALDRVAAFP